LEGSVIKRKINILLLAIPLVIFSESLFGIFEEPLKGLVGEDPKNVALVLNIAVFALAALALIPLAGFVESAVEELAELLGPFVGGLLHTTFGNVAELTIGLSILLNVTGGAEIVEGSIAGVIIRNSLLFLGISTLFGAARNGRMKFDAENASEYTTVFALAVVGLCLPTVANLVFGGGEGEHKGISDHRLVLVSAALAVVLLLSYVAYLAFAVFRLGEGYNLVERRQQKRQARQQRGRVAPVVALPDTQALFAEERASAEQRLEKGDTYSVVRPEHGLGIPKGHRGRIYAKAGRLEEKKRRREAHGKEHPLEKYPILRGLIAVLVLGVATAGVAMMSEHFAESVEVIIKANSFFKDREFFLGLILIPLLAGIVELYGSVSSARENRMEITMAVTAGATIQMILLVVPILVLVGFFAGHPLGLVFQPLEIIIFGAATFIFMLLSRDGESTWLEGVQLCTVWLLLAVVALFIPPIVGG
jgi:Ca2+:H+ antiporter